MSIRMMVGRECAGLPHVETVRNYPGAEAGLINHGKACPLYNKRDVSGTHSKECVRRGSTYGVDRQGNKRPYEDFCGEPFGPLYMATTYVGQVVAIGENNYHDDSDFYAVVVDPKVPGGFKRVEYGTTRAWTYPNSAFVDASPEDQARYADWQRACAQALVDAQRAQARIEGAFNLGEQVKVVKGRKVPIGTVGTVTWAGKNQWNGKPRLGIRAMSGETYFTDGSNLAPLEGA